MEFDKIKFILLKENEMHAMRLINQPSISLIYKNKIKDKIQELWSEYEFNDCLDKIKIEELEEQFKNENNSPIEIKILELLNK